MINSTQSNQMDALLEDQTLQAVLGEYFNYFL